MILDDKNTGVETMELFKKKIYDEFLKYLSSKKIEDVFEFATIDLFNEEYENAIKLFDLCIEKNYNVIDSLISKSMCYNYLDMIKNANNCIDQALKIDENNVKVLQCKSTILSKMDDYEESLKWINKAIELYPDNDENLQIKAIIYFEMKNYDNAFELVDKIIDKNPNNIYTLLLKAKFYEELKDYENTEKCYEIAENIEENNLDILYSKSMFYADNDEFEKANEYIDKCLKIEPQSDLFIDAKLSIVKELDDPDLLDEALNDIYQNPDFTEFNGNVPSLSRNSDKYAIEEFIEYGKDYPSQSMNYNIYKVLSNLKLDSDISNVFSNITLMDSYSSETMTNVMLENNFIQALNFDENNIEKIMLKKTPEEICLLLKQEGIAASGKKKKLVKLALKNVPPFKFCSTFSVTDKGDEFLNDFSWFEIYDECLLPFDLNDVSKYIDDHDKDKPSDLIGDYIKEHVDLAHQWEDFEYLEESLISKSLFYFYQKDYSNCLQASLNHFILKLNPIYEYELNYGIYLIFNSITIENIEKCLEKLNVDIESLFYEYWNLKYSKEDFCSKKEGFNYLKRALDGEDLDELSDEYEKKYIQVISRE